MDDINEYMDYKFQNTYLVYLKMQNDISNPISKLARNTSEINDELKKIYEQNFEKSILVKSYKYGFFGTTENGDYLIRLIKYEGYNLYFVVSPFSIIFINYTEESSVVPKNEISCLSEIDLEKYNDYINKHTYDGFEFTFISTHEPFCNFCNDYYNGDFSKENNSIFWLDFFQYLQGEPDKGKYDVIQLDSLVIVHGYNRLGSKPRFDVANHGIQNPNRYVGKVN